MAGEPIPSYPSGEIADDRLPATRILRAAAEALLFFTIFGGVWAFAGDLPEWEFVLALGVALLTGIWVARCVLYRRLSLRPDFVSAGLSGIILISALQLVPLPQFLVSILAPSIADANKEYRPEADEVIQGEKGPAVARPTFITLSIDPSLTRKFLSEVLAVLFVYTVCRNWLSSRGAFRRFAWVATVSGFFLSLFAFAQYFTSANTSVMYWDIDTGGAVFGPFICRNHYPFFLTPCIGMGCGLLFTVDKSAVQTTSSSSSDSGFKGVWLDFTSWFSQASQSPRQIGLLGMLGVMILSIPFSLSRGGLLSILLASLITAVVWWKCSEKKARADRAGVGAVIGLVLAAFGFAMFLSWNQVEKRVSTLGDGSALESRIPLWVDSLKLIPGSPLFGSGSGTFIRVEPMVRSSGNSVLRNDNAHNELIEALVEGGVLRLILTVLLTYGAIMAAVRGYRRLQGRSTGHLLLGAAFGLTTVALHSIGDFGIHVPAVALLVAAVAGYAAAAADDPDYAPTKRTKHGLSGATHSETDLPRTGEHRTRIRAAVVLTGPPALAGLTVVALIAVLMAWEFRSWDRAERIRSGAVIAAKEDSNAYDLRIRYQEARAEVVPDDPNAFIDLAQANFDAALAVDNGRFESNEAIKYVCDGLKATRTARDLCPVIPQPHFHLGLYKQLDEREHGHKFFVSADSAEVYFDRVTKLIPIDPEAWYAAGVEAYDRGALESAWKKWKRSLELSDRQLAPILEAARKKGITDKQLLDELLPSDAVILMKTADQLYPNPDTEKASRDPFLQRAAEILKTKSSPSVAELEVLARVCENNNDREGARAAWYRAVNADPNNLGLRDRFATWLEGDELFDEAIPQLEFLKAKSYGGDNVRDRVLAAKHSRDLIQVLSGRVR
ncbi:MAG TPA: O-antigen ligase family protein [Fimbriiglobus sp.]|jgi:O-antigen ligase/tetratricopeptide (TPR) repeat protein